MPMSRLGDLRPGEMPFSRAPLRPPAISLIRSNGEDPVPGVLTSMDWTLLGGTTISVPDKPWSGTVPTPETGPPPYYSRLTRPLFSFTCMFLTH